MKTLVIYETEYGNTEKLARAIAEALGVHGEARAVTVQDANGLDVEGLELLVVGTPTQRHGLPAHMKEFLESVPSGTLNDVPALAFDTRYHSPRLFTGSAAKEIGKLLSKRLGCRLLTHPESFFVTGEEGMLEPGEEDRARAWALRSLGRPRPTASSD